MSRTLSPLGGPSRRVGGGAAMADLVGTAMGEMVWHLFQTGRTNVAAE